MHVCLIATELFERGMYGGFGAATRAVAKGLMARGVDVTVVMTRRPGQKPVEISEGITVVSYPGQAYTNVPRQRPFAALFKWIDADIYHSEEPSVGTYLARLGAPDKKHVVTFRDPRRLDEHRTEWKEEGLDWRSLLRREWRYRSSYEYVKKAARAADGKYAAATVVIPRAVELYNLKHPPKFLPTPVPVPKHPLVKADKPTACFLGRWDPRKRPELFFELAKRFPEVRFVAMGACQPHYKQRDTKLRAEYGVVPNLEMPGVMLGEEKSRILEESWILINTSWREGLPISFIEAAAHRCAILSYLNPDGFTENFGYWAREDTLESLETGLRTLLADRCWEEKGLMGQVYVKETFEYEHAIDLHLKAYEELLKR